MEISEEQKKKFGEEAGIEIYNDVLIEILALLRKDGIMNVKEEINEKIATLTRDKIADAERSNHDISDNTQIHYVQSVKIN